MSNTDNGEPWEHHVITTNGIRMHYVTQGQGELIVLLHGFPEFWYSWRLQIPFLAAHGYRVVAPDLRGYNDSEKPAHGYDIPTLLRDIAGLIEALGEQKAIIVGHDWGGVLAWQFAFEYPDLTSRLVVLNAPHPKAMQREMRTFKQLRKSWYVFAFQVPRLPEYLLLRKQASMIGRMLLSSAVQKAAFPPEAIAQYQQAFSKPGVATAALNYYRRLFRRGPRGQGTHTGQISAPTLLIWGEQDIALGIALTYNLERWVPRLQVRRIPASGHWVQQERPDQVNQYLLEFLQTSEEQ